MEALLDVIKSAMTKEKQIRQTICAWSIEIKQSEATLRGVLKVLYSSGRVNLLEKICLGKMINKISSIV